MIDKTKLSSKQIERYTIYLKYLIVLKKSHIDMITSSEIAKEVKCSEETVRKDLQLVSKHGAPGLKRLISDLIYDIEGFLGYHEKKNVIIVGCGKLGTALLSYGGFDEYGINVVAGFDINENLIGTKINDVPIYHINQFKEIISKYDVKTAVLSTRKHCAQELAEKLIDSGIKAIYNFVPLHIINNDDKVLIENFDIASSIAFLSRKEQLMED